MTAEANENLEFLKRVAAARWYMQPEPDEAHVVIVRRDTNRRGLIAPLLTVHVGLGETDEDGEDMVCVEGEEGLILLAAASIPQFLRLLLLIDAQPPMKGEDDGFTPNASKAILARARWLLEMLTGNDNREPMGEGNFSLMTYEEANPAKESGNVTPERE